MSQHERNGWRDEELSRRHRSWGHDCPAVDCDALFFEYNHALPAAIVEYKHHKAALVDFNSPNILVKEEVARRCEIPFFVAVYWPGEWCFLIHPGNDHARRFLGSPRYMSERMWVELMYRVRENELRKHVSEQLSSVVVPKDAATCPHIILRKSDDAGVIRFRDVV